MSTDFIDTDNAWRIPSTELNGSNASKVMQIDSLLSQLRATRHQLMRDARVVVLDEPELPEMTARDWWLAGTAFVVLIAALTIGAWITGAGGDQSGRRSVLVVHESF